MAAHPFGERLARAWSTSATVTLAPWAMRSSTSGPPTPPVPCTVTVRPSSDGEPNAWATLALMPWSTPSAVSGALEPEPPCASVLP